jgi:hypothetical protein
VPHEDRDRPAAEQTIFVLSPLSQAERMAVWDDGSWIRVESDGSKVIAQRGYQQALEMVRTHVVDVQNLQDADGNVLPFPKDGTPAERAKFLECLDDVDVLIIGQYIRDRSSIGEPEKNLLAPTDT